MKNALLFGASMLAVAAASTVSASAADMYAGFKDGPVYANTWTGFYAGVHIGGAWGSNKVTDVDGWDGIDGFSFSNDPSGLFGGAQAGYNWQHGNVVLGLEADFGVLDLNRKTREVTPQFADTDAVIHGGTYGDLTGRLGYAFGPALLYAKGGFAFFDGEAKAVTGGSTPTTTDTFTGWTLGGGLEYALNPAWSLKAEYQHFDFGKEQTVATNSSFWCGGNCRYAHDLTVDTVKVGINHHFGRSYEPLK